MIVQKNLLHYKLETVYLKFKLSKNLEPNIFCIDGSLLFFRQQSNFFGRVPITLPAIYHQNIKILQTIITNPPISHKNRKIHQSSKYKNPPIHHQNVKIRQSIINRLPYSLHCEEASLSRRV